MDPYAEPTARFLVNQLEERMAEVSKEFKYLKNEERTRSALSARLSDTFRSWLEEHGLLVIYCQRCNDFCQVVSFVVEQPDSDPTRLNIRPEMRHHT